MAQFDMPMHTFLQLRQERLARATKPFKARGAQLVRCERCLLGQAYCICPSLNAVPCAVDWVLLMHPDEVLKPTNSGRLLAELFPHNTQVFEWSRTCAPQGLRELLNDSSRLPMLVFPAEHALATEPALNLAIQQHKRLTLILLDGTWKQARKMFNRTPWLEGLSSISPAPQTAQYSLRKAAHANCLSTAEAAILLLADLDAAAAAALDAVFTEFNANYVHTRGLRPQP